MKQALCSITSNVEVMPGIHLMWIEAPDIAVAAQPGQFITVRCGDFTLRRPFSIHQVGNSNVIASPAAIGTKQSQLAILFKSTGKGTLWLSQRKAGQKIDILGPLGKGFSIEPRPKKLLLVAGGIGLAPLIFLMQQALSQHQITLIHGASTAAQLYPDSCQLSAISYQTVQFIPVTEDGSTGQKGKATDVLPDSLDWADQVYACGPVDMYKAMALSLNPSPLKGEGKTIVGEGLVPSHNLKLKKSQVSLEVRMGCGFGACYGCTINTKKGLRHVCRDGPVFELDDIIWKEVRI
ncbi:MAG: dihydroorotate dehydrogenase electron transfer subunit [Dehalococcoidia bacterium]